MTRPIRLSITGKQLFALPGSPMMEKSLQAECEEAFRDLRRELEGQEGPVEVILVGEEADGELAGEEREKDRLIGALVGKIMETAHELSPRTEFFTQGSLVREADGICLIYEESALTGMEDSVTALRIGNDGVVSLNRGGKVATNLVFEKGKRCQCVFDGYGPKGLPVCVYTRDLRIRVGEDSGNVRVDYLIEVGGAKTEHDEFLIRWDVHKEKAERIE